MSKDKFVNSLGKVSPLICWLCINLIAWISVAIFLHNNSDALEKIYILITSILIIDISSGVSSYLRCKGDLMSIMKEKSNKE